MHRSLSLPSSLFLIGLLGSACGEPLDDLGLAQATGAELPRAEACTFAPLAPESEGADVRALVRLADGYAAAGVGVRSNGISALGWVRHVGPDGAPRWRYDLPGPVAGVHGLAAAPDGDLFVTGHAEGLVSAVVRLDSHGAPRWRTAAPVSGLSFGSALLPLNDGGLLVAGSAELDRLFVARLDAATGEVEWIRTYVLGAQPYVARAMLLGDGGFALAGFLASGGKAPGESHNPESLFATFDAAGELRWHRGYADRSTDQLWGAGRLGDGGFILAGESTGDDGAPRPRLVRIDAAGEPVWAGAPGGRRQDFGRLSAAAELPGGDLVAAGWHASGPLWLLRFDADGRRQWERAFSAGARVTLARDLVVEPDGGLTLAVVGADVRGGELTSSRPWLLRVDANGRCAR